MGEDLLATLSIENHRLSTHLSMDPSGCPLSSSSSHDDPDRELLIQRHQIILSGAPDINLHLSTERSPSDQSWNSDSCDIFDVGLGSQVYEAEATIHIPKVSTARKCTKRGDNIWGAWFFFNFYFKPVLSEKFKGKITWDAMGVWAGAKRERAMPALTCNACSKEFDDEMQQKLHYRSEWHRYNLKRKVAGVPGVTEELFQARQLVLAEENSKLSATPMLYGCALCGKEYRSSKAHAQHLKSRAHAMKTSEKERPSAAGISTVKPYAARTLNKTTNKTQFIGENEDDDGSEDEWEVVNEMDMASESLSFLHVGEGKVAGEDEQGDIIDEELDTSCCFICDQKYESIENCMVHMHKQHGFFIPDIEYLEDPEGLLTYVGLKVKRDFACLYCSDRCLPFQSLEAVRKHMIAKGHCKLRYGDGGDDEDVDLEDFYDYSSSYADADGKQLMSAENMENSVELGSGGAELIIKQKTETGVLVRTLGSREFLRYYRQKPRPSPTREIALALSLATRYRSMGLATVHSKEPIVRMKVIREINRRGVEAMRSKIGMKSNVIRNLPKNVTY